ncbi:hypothetical protein [Nonomuraea dietziae]|uniref:Uncharacterized protein n=1 Tax=Nonomuraea dietziae TaxID=65515 RepID=A0A7W5VLS4_9ACTN|nr:hypothetical protein [Nonomuraea dietziae]MBB3733735.1 hypothetical protein [Nonomuraea dietziae]
MSSLKECEPERPCEQQEQLGVVEALAEHFDDLRDGRTTAVAVEAIEAHLAAPP